MSLGHREKHRPEDDVEANAPEHGSSGSSGPDAALDDEHKLSEYDALDRFITNYDASGQQRGAHETEGAREHIPWWKFWKSSDHGSEQSQSDREGKPPPEWLETDIHAGISSSEVAERRRRFGWNELTAEKENQFAKFLSFFQGPILYGRSLPRRRPPRPAVTGVCQVCVLE